MRLCPPLFTLAVLALCPCVLRAECNAEAVDYAVAQQLTNLHCTTTKAAKSLFSQTFFIYASCQADPAKKVGAILYYDSNTCLRTKD